MSSRVSQKSAGPDRPFRRQPFAHLPEQPARVHPYYMSEAHEAAMESAALGTLRIHYRTYGDGEPLLLVHGLMTSSYSWRYVLDGLGAHYRLIIPDLPGAGRSSGPSRRLSVARLGSWLGEFQEAIGVRGCAVMGNSLGGYLVLSHALADPGAYSRVVAIHPPAFPEARLHAMRAALSLPGAGRVFGSWVRRDTARWAHRTVHYYDDTLKSLEEMREYGDPLKSADGTRAFVSYLRDVMRPSDFAEFVDELRWRGTEGRSFPVPLQLLYARQDPMVDPSVGERLAALIPDARLDWVERSSHFVQVDSPAETVACVLRFLDLDGPR
ncbi:alpha/beta hydrolase [Nocardia sp. BSTN01]|uniref:alpha/beta fold hydrolase n=1 Tax=Nocardia sp. BSTN01 TaxID=2783665 RepID=UPI00188F8C30|nr:alpha/beta hydrolase [Nocardia sp. BSTN01]MBF4998659.1 alpha/beta hydrolase [Nocardia sp. BSTN01]